MPIPHKMKLALKRYRPKIKGRPDDACSYADFMRTRPNPSEHMGNPFDSLEVESTLMNLAMRAILNSPALFGVFKSTDPDKDFFTVPIDITDTQGRPVMTTEVIVPVRDVLNERKY